MEKCVMVFSSTTQFANIDKDCKTQKVEMEFRKLFGYFGEVKIHQWNVEWNEWIEVNEKNQPIYAHPLKFKFFKSPSQVYRGVLIDLLIRKVFVEQVLGNLSVESTAVLCCDMQERFRSAIQYFTEIVQVGNRVLKASQILSMPLIVTEQYPKGLLKTVSELDISHASHVIEKTKFSMCLPQVDEFLLQNSRVKNVVLFGVEAHVCVQQTALDLVQRGVQVHVVADATSSRSQSDRLLAFQRLRAAGAVITTSEAVLFQLIGDKQHDKFKEIQSLIRTLPPDTGLAMAPKSSI